MLDFKDGSLQKKSVLRNKSFLILLVTGGVMALGNKIYELALPLILYDLTKSSVIMSTMRGIEFLPNLFLAMFIGVLVDRSHKKTWSLVSILMQVVVLLVLYVSLEMGYSSAPLFYIAGFLLMTFGYAYSNARVAMVKQSLPGEMLTSANVSYNFAVTLIGILGPALSGLLLILPNMHVALLLTAIAFMLAWITLTGVKTEETHVKDSGKDFWRELHEGWRELRSNRLLSTITVVVIFLNSSAGMIDATLIFYAKDSLKLTNAQLGLVLSAAGIGGLAGSMLIGLLRRYYKVGQIISWTVLGLGLTSVIFYFSHTIWMLFGGLLLYGVFETINTVSIWTFRQESTPHDLIGRVSGITGSLFKLGLPFAIMASGWIVKLASPQLVFLIAFGINMLIFGGCMMSSLNRKRI
ncbi:MFS transporter [Paenibacillus sp. HJL G12]|uniref:MFS transporter n=1 Tax=Paenibacillus dendrobii TaxID=2691084 RepID=A0A7X3LFD9_9BACL|nr:MFS transporter [Paenibacillus dendrobii]MWV42922.1 MFS transporter [Paenibacillus dendrobii]